MKLKVLWLSHFVPYPPRGGALQRSHYLLREAASRHRVRVIALNQRALLPDAQARNDAAQAVRSLGVEIEVFDLPADRSRVHWLLMAAAGALRGTPYDVNWLRSTRFAAATAEALRQDSFDVIHVDTIGLVPEVPPGLEPQVVLNHHNIESHMLARRVAQERQGWKRWYLEREAGKLEQLERRICPRVGVNLVVSRLDGERLSSIIPSGRIAVVENGVDPAFFSPGPDGPGPATALVFAGTMGWYPNADAMRFFLEECWPELRRRDPAFRLTIVGRGPTEQLRVLAARSPGVSVTGAVPDVRPYLQSAGVYVCPIREGGGTRLKVLDALASGLPMVATPLAVEGLDLAPDRHFLAATSGEDFACRILQLRDTPALRRSLATEGRRVVEHRFAWDVIGQQLEHAYQTVASGPG